MSIILNIEYLVNVFLVGTYILHMFQLNSYSLKKHVNWLKNNYIKHIVNVVGPIASYLLFGTTLICNILSIIIMAVVIIYNVPKSKAKKPLHLTTRVIRMIITQTLLAGLLVCIFGIQNYITLKLMSLNIIVLFLVLIANLINIPIEKMVRNKYIKEAKKIINDMPNLLVIGVTGSYGKTSVKNYLYKLLSAKYNVLVTPLNYNTTMGVVKTIRENLRATHQIFICEMGAERIGEIKEICDIVNPKMGIITSIGPQHLETFGSIDNIIKTKFELADSVKKNNGTIFLNYNNEYIVANLPDMQKVLYGVESKDLDYYAKDMKSTSKGLSFKTNMDDNLEFKTKLIGRHNIINIMAAISVADKLNVPVKVMQSKIREIESVEHRLQLIDRGNIAIIDDSYNSNPVSSKSAIDTLGEFEGTKIIVTPGLIELGKDEEKYNYELGQYMVDVCNYIYLVGKEHSKPILDGIKSKGYDENKIYIVSSPKEAMEKIANLNISGKIIVLLENDLPDNYK